MATKDGNLPAAMIYSLLNILPWLLFTFTFSESVTLKVQDTITVDCGKPVTLHCEVSSSLSGLSIKHMEWSQSQPYCSVDNEGHLTAQSSSGGFHCEYEDRKLTLYLYEWLPEHSDNPFMCKVRTNQGIHHEYTQVETREHWEGVEAEWHTGFPTCTFRQVCPGGLVDWFQGSQKITNKSLISTKKHAEGGRWFTIYSSLTPPRPNEQYSCALRSARSGQYLTSASSHSPSYITARAATHVPLGRYLGIVVGFIVKTYFY